MFRQILNRLMTPSRKREQKANLARKQLTRALRLEPLESRKVFATMVDAFTVTFQDKDGDQAQVSFFNPIFTAANVNSILKFDFQDVNGFNYAKQQLKEIRLDGVVGASHNEVSVKVTKQGATGDGFVHVGQVMAEGVDFGVVQVQGDLGRVMVGDSDFTTPALEELVVQSIGMKGISTGATQLVSSINGLTGTITVYGDISGAGINVKGALGTVDIGGSLRGSLFANTGKINVNGTLSNLKIGQDVVGGYGDSSGRIEVIGKIEHAKIFGSIRGAKGAGSGALVAAAGFDEIWLQGDLTGGNGDGSGAIATLGDIQKMSMGGSIYGAGTGMRAGELVAWGNVNELLVIGSIHGGSGSESGLIDVQHTISKATIGAVIGGGGNYSGRIKAGDMTQISIGEITGGNGNGSGTVEATQSITGFTVNKNITGGAGAFSGFVQTSKGDIQELLVSGNLKGGKGTDSGAIRSGHAIGSIHIAGSIVGGAGQRSGRLAAITSIDAAIIDGNLEGNLENKGLDTGVVQSDGDIGSVTVGALLGGLGSNSGRIHAAKDIKSLEVKGDVTGSKGTNSAKISSGGNMLDVRIGGSLKGGTADFTGLISAGQELRSLKIGNDLKGGDMYGKLIPGKRGLLDLDFSDNPNGLSQSGYVQARTLTSMEVGGSIIAGVNLSQKPFGNNGAVRALDNLGTLTVHGNLEGNRGNPVIIAARGLQSNLLLATDLAIGTVHVDGDIKSSEILAGVDGSNRMINADASIGTIFVGHDWYDSDAVAGVVAGADGRFGNYDDAKASGTGTYDHPSLHSTIDSVTIVGQVSGDRAAMVRQLGIVAEQINNVKVGKLAYYLQPGISNDHINVGGMSDLSVHEVGVKKPRNSI